MTGQSPNLKVAVVSEKGRRDENQDWLSWTQSPWGELFIVADGMGGYKGGARAAQMTVEGIEKRLTKSPVEVPFVQALKEAIQETNAEVHRAATSGDPETEKMGSTVVVALVSEGKVQVGHVGDSRAYILKKGSALRGSHLVRLTKDHTSVQQMLDAGIITLKQAKEHPDSHILSRAIGSKPEVEVEIGELKEWSPGDALLMCSDGLSGFVEDQEIKKVLDETAEIQQIPNALVNLALNAGGNDNITVQFVRLESPRQTALLPNRPKPRRQLPLAAMASAALILFSILFWPTIAKRLVPPFSGPSNSLPGGGPSAGANRPGNGAVNPPGNGAVDPPGNGAVNRSGGNGVVTPPPPAPAPAPKIASFTAEPATVQQGGESVLRWRTENADTVSIRPGPPDQRPTSTFKVKPGVTTTYTASAKGRGGTVEKSITVEVRTPSPVTVAILVVPSASTDAAELKTAIDSANNLSSKPEGYVIQADAAATAPQLETIDESTWIYYTDDSMKDFAPKLGEELGKFGMDFLNLDRRTGMYPTSKAELRAFVEEQLGGKKPHLLLIVQPSH